MPPSPAPPQHRDLGAILVGLGALLLFVSLFLHWYQPGRSAWTVFEVWDLVLAGLAAVALGGALARFGVVPGHWERWTSGCCAAALLIVVFSLINHPPAAEGAGPMIGIWLALVATVAMVAGVLVGRARISLVIERVDPSPGAEPRSPLGLGALRRSRRGRRPSAPSTGAPGPAAAADPPAPPPPSPPPPPPPPPDDVDPGEEPTRSHPPA